MKTRFVSFAAIACAILPLSASAESLTENSVTLSYDAQMVADDLSAPAAMAAIKAQARKACRLSATLYGGGYVDAECVTGVLDRAIPAIVAEQTAAGLPTAQLFLDAMVIETAALEQR